MTKKQYFPALLIVVVLFVLAYLIISWQEKTVPVSYLSKINLENPPSAEEVNKLRHEIIKIQIKKQNLKERPLFISNLTFNLLNLPASAVSTETLTPDVIKDLPVEAHLVDPEKTKIPRFAVKVIFSPLLTADNSYLLAAEINGRFLLYQVKKNGKFYRSVDVTTLKTPKKSYEVEVNEAKIMAAAVSTALAGRQFPVVYILNKTSETISTKIFPSRFLPSNFITFLRGIPVARLVPSLETVMPNWQEGPRGGGVIVFISNIHRLNDRVYINLDIIGGQKRSFYQIYQIWLKGNIVILKIEVTSLTSTFVVR